MTGREDLVLEKDEVFDGDLTCGNITCKGTKRYNLTVKGKLDCHDITAGNITARDINALDITALNITAGNITAGNITARDINALNITAWDISYYAVCFAYRGIKCKSIRGCRENSRHFALDGKVEVHGGKE